MQLDKKLLEEVKKTILAVEPGSDVILYGSRSRGDATEESDWDFLVLVDGPVTMGRTDRLRHKVYKLERERGEVFSVIVRNRMEWDRFPYNTMPIYQEIAREGIRL